VNAHNADLLNTALNVIGFNAMWVGTAVESISGSTVATEANYKALVLAEKQVLGGCASCRDLAGPPDSKCAPSDGLCQHDVTNTDVQMGQILDDLIGNAAPSSMASKDSHLEADLAAADSALVGVVTGFTTNDQPAFNSGRAAYAQALTAIESDMTAIAG
jgi:hypothetical protein